MGKIMIYVFYNKLKNNNFVLKILFFVFESIVSEITDILLGQHWIPTGPANLSDPTAKYMALILRATYSKQKKKIITISELRFCYVTKLFNLV